MTKPFISQLLEGLASDSVSVSESLRKARIAADRLKLGPIATWIDLELKGYNVGDTLPEYRKIQGQLQGYNPYYGWQPVLTDDKDFIALVSSAPIGSPIGVIEDDDRKRENGDQIEFALPADKRAALSALLRPQTNVRLLLPPSAPKAILEAVRNLLMDWCLDLERAGIKGEGLEFSAAEKNAAPIATDRFVIQHSVIGNLVGNATSSNISAASTSLPEIGEVREIAAKLKDAIAALPAAWRTDAAQIASELEREVAKSNPDDGAIKESLASLRKIAESASGNLTAQGILAALRTLIGP